MTVGIIGLGLMGGSLGIALKSTETPYRIIGYDHNPTHCKEAVSLELVDEIASSIDEIIACDVIVLSIPVNGIIKALQNLTTVDAHTTIIDLGSTKEKIVASVPNKIRANFVAAHPMTGTEKFGPTAAIEDLYRDKVVVLCDMEDSGKRQQEIAKSIFDEIGMRLVFMGAKEHDRHAAFISHMPHALSFSLANAVMGQEDPKSITALAGGGFRDMSRIAKSSPHMWEDVFRQNRDNLIVAIKNFKEELNSCQKMIENEEWDALNRWMSDANKLHDIL
ncbi:Prephenate and/or arogenate dehydrogenase (unknown specificity) [hydrothermal vent metagenome]|uniref:Prephenate/arogenate dehydrogenase domain-containing protein n=1 Tax=hydrothermal vent metagenome TaxID=652676 RepID=A0A1W1BLY6_9ZZZZ